MKKILHIITGLKNGGAEGVLYRLCKHDKSCNHIVISLTDEGKYSSLLEQEGIETHCLYIGRGFTFPLALWRLFNLLRKHKPDVVQNWMYHADLIGGIVARLAGIKHVFWNVRHTALEPGKSKRSTILIAKMCSFLSNKIPKKIMYCAYEAQIVHEAQGYQQGKGYVVPNGYDLTKFSISTAIGKEFREAVSVNDDDFLIGMVGRYNPQKDHENLIHALGLVRSSGIEFKLVLIGVDLDAKNQEVIAQIEMHNLFNNVLLLGQRTDIPSAMNGLDIHVLSSSFGEAFPNVLAEAMACGTPCVTTDVGDAALIVGDTGWIVEPKKPYLLAHAIVQAMEDKKADVEGWVLRQKNCRNRIVENFNIEKMIEHYHNTWFS